MGQVSHILNINLSVFQDVEYNPENQAELNRHWHDIEAFTSIVDSFIAKIEGQPEYYKKVIHNPHGQKQLDEYSKIIRIKDTARVGQLLEELERQPYYYPPDYGYLSEGRILKDLDILRKTLACYKKNGVTKVRLEYM